MVRARRNCSEDADFQAEVEAIQTRLRHRGCPGWVLCEASRRVGTRERGELLREKYNKVSSDNNKVRDISPIVFSTPFSLEYGQICSLVKKYMPILLFDPALENVFRAGYKCVARKAPTLGQELSPSLFVQPNKRIQTGYNIRDPWA